MVARIWWVRHGPTHERAFTGWRDVAADLSDVDAISRLDRHIPRYGLLVSSDLVRARATADRLTGGTRIRLADDPSLREFDFGAWDGLTFDEVAARDPDLSRAFWETPGDVRAPGGECWNEVSKRVDGAVARLSGAHPGRDLIAVAHMGVILCHLASAGGIGVTRALGYRIDPLSVTRLTRDGAGWRIEAVNHRP